MNRTIIMCALALTAIGCSSDATSAPNAKTDPDACSKGSISAGDNKNGQLGSASCLRYDFAYSQDSVFYDTYSFTAVKGKGYWFALDNADETTNFDAVLEMAAIDPVTGGEQLLQISDDEGPQNYSRMYFIAPVSGTFTLRASGYDSEDTAAYKLSAKSCATPLPQITGDLASTSQTLDASDCVLAKPEFGSDSTHVKLYSLHIGPNETRVVTVTSSDFTPGFQMFGPAWGVDCAYGYEGCGSIVADVQDSDTATGSLTTGGGSDCSGNICQYTAFPGDYTLAVGAAGPSQLGSFTLQVSSSFPVTSRVGPPSNSTYTPVLNWLAKKPLKARDYLRRVH